MKPCIIIPARYESDRFPGKPLANILGKSMIYRVWERCIQAIPRSDVWVATDSYIIANHCKKYGMKVVMTGECLTGTDRVAEAYNSINIPYDVIINVQGDEPMINPEDIRKVIRSYNYNEILCGFASITDKREFHNPNIIKIIMNSSSELIYASRAGIPANKKGTFIRAYKQICIYAFNDSMLSLFHVSDKSKIESIEDIEILRFLEMGLVVNMVEVRQTIAVDYPEDINRVEKYIKKVLNEYE